MHNSEEPGSPFSVISCCYFRMFLTQSPPQAEDVQLPQLSAQRCGLLLTVLQLSHAFPLVRNWTQGYQMGSKKCWVEWDSDFAHSTGCASVNTVLGIVGFLHSNATLPAHGHITSHQGPPGPFQQCCPDHTTARGSSISRTFYLFILDFRRFYQLISGGSYQLYAHLFEQQPCPQVYQQHLQAVWPCTSSPLPGH